MRYIIILSLILSWNYADSQNKIFYKSADVYNYVVPEQGIKKIRTPWGNHGRFLLLIKNDESKTKIRKKDLWGFQNAQKKLLRFSQGNTYEIVDSIALVIIYKTYSPKPVYYFSESLESKVLLLEKKKVIKTLGIDKFNQLYKYSPLIRTLT